MESEAINGAGSGFGVVIVLPIPSPVEFTSDVKCLHYRILIFSVISSLGY